MVIYYSISLSLCLDIPLSQQLYAAFILHAFTSWGNTVERRFSMGGGNMITDEGDIPIHTLDK
jgi:hypothetical protein